VRKRFSRKDKKIYDTECREMYSAGGRKRHTFRLIRPFRLAWFSPLFPLVFYLLKQCAAADIKKNYHEKANITAYHPADRG